MTQAEDNSSQRNHREEFVPERDSAKLMGSE